MRSHIQGPLLKLSVNHLLVQWDLFTFNGVTLLQTNQMTIWIIIPSYTRDLTLKGPFLKLSVNHLLVQWDLFTFSGVTLLQTNQNTIWVVIPSYTWDLTFKGPL